MLDNVIVPKLHVWPHINTKSVKACTIFCKCPKALNTFLFLFSCKMFVIRDGIQKRLVRIANGGDPDQTASSEAV